MLYNDYLAHFGILGQKWGVRRFQNKDGSLTPEGKKRYYTSAEIEKEFDDKIQKSDTRVNKIIDSGEHIVDKANSVGKEYELQYKNVKLSDKDKKDIWEELHQDFGSGSDDNELFDMVAEEYIGNKIDAKVKKAVQKSQKELDAMQEEYWNDVHDFTKEFYEKYENKRIIDLSRMAETSIKWVMNDAIGEKLQTGFLAYLSRHFEDYWVYDTKSRYEAISELKKEFTQETYNKKYT